MGLASVGSPVVSTLSITKTSGPNTINGNLGDFANSRKQFIKSIGAYLRALQQRKPTLATQIETFTRSFGEEYATFSITNYLRQVENLDRMGVCTDDFSVAMTPESIVDFLQQCCGLPNARKLRTHNVLPPWSRRTPPRECIIGLSGQGQGAPHKGLAHWVYKRDQTIYSWGKIFAHTNYQGHPDFARFGPACYYIGLR